MTPLSRHQIEGAIITVRSSFSYDPPERWRSAYDMLQPVRGCLHDAAGAYSWVSVLAFVLYLAAMAAIGFAWFTSPIANFTPLSIWLAVPVLALLPGIIELGQWLATALARRREPLLALRDEIEAACRPFDSIAPTAFVNPDDPA